MVQLAVAFRLRHQALILKTVPDWLIIGLELPLWPASDDTGQTPDQTALYAEGCVEVNAAAITRGVGQALISGYQHLVG